MSELSVKSFHKLELSQVLDMLAEGAGSAEGKRACRQLVPESDLDEVRILLDQTSAAVKLCEKNGNPNFSSVCDLSVSLERADRGGALTPKELLEIAGVLRCARNVRSYLKEDDDPTALDAFFLAVTPNKYLEERIGGAILSEEEIADTASSELADIRRHMRIQSAKIRDSLQKIISSFVVGCVKVIL